MMETVINQTGWDDIEWHGYTLVEDRQMFCESDPYSLSSFGVWERMMNRTKGMRNWEYPLPSLEIMICSALFLWLSFDLLFRKLHIRMPKFTCMMLAGVILDQASLFNRGSLIHRLYFPDDFRPKIAETLGAFGFTLFWFLKGVTMDVKILKRTGPRVGVIGFATMAAPLFIGYVILTSKLKRGDATLKPFEYRIITYMESISAFTVINMFLKDLKISHSEFGRIAQSSAMLTDLVAFGLNFFSVIWWEGKVGVWKTIGGLLFFVLMIYIVRPAMVWIIKNTPEGRPIKNIYIYLILLLAYLSHHYWKYLGFFGPAGPFVLGMTVPDGPPLGSAFVQRFESFNTGVLLPLFGALNMMQIDALWFFEELGKVKHLDGQFLEAVSFILLVSSAKFLFTTISAFSTKMPLRESLVLALILSNKGIFELAYYMFAVEVHAFRPKVFTTVAISTLVNSLIVPIALDFLYVPAKIFASYRKRNVLNLKPDAELPLLVCIHKPDHIDFVINVLKAFRPSKDSPISCYVLHLVELMGQAIPTFISHQLQKPEVGTTSRSNNVITSFRHLQQNFAESMSVHMFTSVSSAKHMHEDICWLSLDKSLSVILLPFHRTWSLDLSTVVSDDESIRNLNLNVLKRAPCSVAVLVYRNPILASNVTNSHCKVCLVFVDGRDDREALALTNRMRVMNREISLTVLRLTPSSVEEDKGSAQILSTNDLKEIIRNYNDDSGVGESNSVKYIEKEVADGTETSDILQSMAFDYDLFIVGRNKGMDNTITKGLTEWIEFEELGVIGDLLASPDYHSRTSVMVIQQQEYVANR